MYRYQGEKTEYAMLRNLAENASEEFNFGDCHYATMSIYDNLPDTYKQFAKCAVAKLIINKDKATRKYREYRGVFPKGIASPSHTFLKVKSPITGKVYYLDGVAKHYISGAKVIFREKYPKYYMVKNWVRIE